MIALLSQNALVTPGVQYVDDFDLPPEQVASARRIETLARKINLLLDVIMQESGKPFDFAAVKAHAKAQGYELSRTRWSLLLNGKHQVVPEETLRVIANVFDVDPEYLLQEDGKLPEQVEAELELLRALRRAEVRNFAIRALGPVDQKALTSIINILGNEPPAPPEHKPDPLWPYMDCT